MSAWARKNCLTQFSLRLATLARQFAWRQCLVLVFGFCLGLTALAGCMVPTVASAQELEEKKDATKAQLDKIHQQIELKESRKKELAAEIATLEKDRTTFNRELIETTNKARELETRIDENAKKLEKLLDNENDTRQSLNRRRGLLSEVLAALQRMGKNPPPAILVKPEEALSSIRSAILLGSVVPEIRNETEILLVELKELVRIRTEVEKRSQILNEDKQKLAEEEERLNLLIAQKKENAGKARADLAKESQRAAELAAKANNLDKLIASLETEIASAREAAEAARRAEEERKKREDERIASARQEIEAPDFNDTGRNEPAVAFTKTRGLLPRPVNGVEVISYGKKDNFGTPAAGVSIATRNSARVIAPADGWVVYSGPFRSYGQLLIINLGENYHMVLAGMEAVNVDLGQFVLAGEPIGQMGATRIASSGNVDIGSQRPILYVEFRKDGHSIDPGPWWVPENSESKTDDS